MTRRVLTQVDLEPVIQFTPPCCCLARFLLMLITLERFCASGLSAMAAEAGWTAAGILAVREPAGPAMAAEALDMSV